MCKENKNNNLINNSSRVPDWPGREVIFIFFAHKKYSRSFIKLQLNDRCHMDCFNNVITTLNVVVVLLLIQGQKALGFHQKYLHLSLI